MPYEERRWVTFWNVLWLLDSKEFCVQREDEDARGSARLTICEEQQRRLYAAKRRGCERCDVSSTNNL